MDAGATPGTEEKCPGVAAYPEVPGEDGREVPLGGGFLSGGGPGWRRYRVDTVTLVVPMDTVYWLTRCTRTTWLYIHVSGFF